jgi:hypothetical protein
MAVKGPQIIFIRWIDATGADGWVRASKLIEDENKLAEIETIGYLVHEDKQSITLTMAKDISNGNCGAYMSIPKVCITKRKLIKV